MSRLWERIVEHRRDLRLLPRLEQCQNSKYPAAGRVAWDAPDHIPAVVVADNVCRYFYEGNDQEDWDLGVDFPSFAPPWPEMFIEFGTPTKTVSREMGVNPIDRSWWGSHRGVHIQSHEKKDVAGKVPEEVLRSFPDEARWLQVATVFVEFAKNHICIIAEIPMFIRPDGTVVNREKWPYLIAGLPTVAEAYGAEYAQELADNIMHVYGWAPLYVAAMTLSFINCRNTVVTDHHPPPALAKACRRRGKEPPVTYKTLAIEPVKRLLSEEGKKDSQGLKHALHICRGHFKDYRARGLFGKAKGIYWWGMHVRGDIESGLVVKDYKVKK